MKTRDTVVVNLFGGPGCGKSTCAAYLFSQLKKLNYDVEMVCEFTKDLYYLTSITPPYNQAYVFGNQLWRIEQYAKETDIVITDSPLPLSIVYKNSPYLNNAFSEMVLEAFNHFNNINYLINGYVSYNRLGRFQSETEAKQIHNKTEELLIQYHIPYKEISYNDYDVIVKEIIALCRSAK